MAELVDAADLKSVSCKGVRVQVPLRAPLGDYSDSNGNRQSTGLREIPAFGIPIPSSFKDNIVSCKSLVVNKKVPSTELDSPRLIGS